jgi:protein required for attachment to host cells
MLMREQYTKLFPTFPLDNIPTLCYILVTGGKNMKILKAHKKDSNTITVNKEFLSVDTRGLDSKHRITLQGRWYKHFASRQKADSYQVFVDRDGDILLRPAVTIPSNEAWIYQNPKVIGKIRKGLEDAASGKTEKVDDLDNFLNNL